MLRTSPSSTTYVFPSRRCFPARAASACPPASTRSSHRTTSQRMRPRAMSEWIVSPAELRRLLRRQLRKLRLELKVDAIGTVDQLEQRLRRERVQLGRQLALPVGERAAGVEMRKQPFELLRLGPEAHIPRLRLLRHSLEPALDVVAVGDEQLELQRLEVVGGNAGAGEAVEDDEKRVDLSQVAEQRRACPGNVDHAHRRGRDLA